MIFTLLSRAYASAPILLCLATFGWGSNAVASRLAVDEVSPMMLIFLRWGLVVIIVLVMHGREMIMEWPVIRRRLGWVFFNGWFWVEYVQRALLHCSPQHNRSKLRYNAEYIAWDDPVGIIFDIWHSRQ